MATKQSHAERKAAALAAADGILKAAKDAGRDLTTDEVSKVEAHMDDVAAASADAAREEQALRAIARVEEARESLARSQGRKAPEASSAPMVAHESALDDTRRGFKTPREFLGAVVNYGRGMRADQRLKPLLATAGSDEAGGYSDAYGGVLVPAGFLPNLLAVNMAADPIAPLVTRVPMATPKITIPARVDKTQTSSVSGGLRVYRRQETAAVTASRMQMEGVTLDASPLMGLSYATEEILTDSVVSFIALLEQGFRDEFTAKMVQERISGNGAGMFLGVLNSGCLISVTKETGQAAASIVYENIIKMYARGYQPQCWIANQTVITELAKLNLSVGTAGTPVWMPSAREGVPNQLLGLPIFYTQHCPTLGTVGDLILCNWSQYLEGTYEPLGSAESMHVRFENHERAFKFWMRNDGRPWWSAALTPDNGDTLSPFVALATRS